MVQKEKRTLLHILDESPFFIELSIKERESLVKELLMTYPQLRHYSDDSEVGYEASWFSGKIL